MAETRRPIRSHCQVNTVQSSRACLLRQPLDETRAFRALDRWLDGIGAPERRLARVDNAGGVACALWDIRTINQRGVAARFTAFYQGIDFHTTAGAPDPRCGRARQAPCQSAGIVRDRKGSDRLAGRCDQPKARRAKRWRRGATGNGDG